MLLHCGKAGDIADDSAGTKLGVKRSFYIYFSLM